MDDPQARRQSDGGADADVIARVLGGDVQAYATLVTRYQRALYRHAVAMVLDHDAASDMVQEAFVRAYTSLRECRDRSRFRAWLFQTLRHRCLDYLKEPRRRHVALDAAENVCDQGDGPATLAERQQTRQRIEDALAQLPPVQREVFVMHYVDGMPYDAIAELLDVSLSAVKMRALRARDALSSALRDEVTAGPWSSSLYEAR